MSLKYSGREKEGRGWDGRWGGDVVAKPLAFSHSVVCLHLDEMKCLVDQGRCGGPVTISVAANTPAPSKQLSLLGMGKFCLVWGVWFRVWGLGFGIFVQGCFAYHSMVGKLDVSVM